MPDKKEIIKMYGIKGKKYYQQKLTYEQLEDMTDLIDESLWDETSKDKKNDLSFIIDIVKKMFKKQKLVRKIIPILLIEDGKEYNSEKRVKIRFNKIEAETVVEVIQDFLSLNSRCGVTLMNLIGQMLSLIPENPEWKIPENVRTSVG